MKCPYCREEIENDIYICPICGEKIPKIYKYLIRGIEYCKENIFKLIKNKKFIISVLLIIFSVLSYLAVTTVIYHVNNPIVNAKFITDENTEGTFFSDQEDLCSAGYVNHLVDKNGNPINDVKYGACPGFLEYPDQQCYFEEGLACVCVKKDGKDKCGYINDKGKFVIEPLYDNASPFSKGVATVKKGKTFGILHKNGKFVPVDCEFMSNFSNGYARISKKGKDALINAKGEITVPYRNALMFEYYYESGDYVLECKGNEDNNYGEYCAYVRKKDGKPITDYKYSAMGNGGCGSREFNRGLAVAIENDKINLIDKKGKVILRTNYIDSPESYFDGELLRVTKDHEKFGYIDKRGNVIIPLEYSEIGPFYKGYAFVRKDKKVGYVNKKNVYNKINVFELPADVIAPYCFYGFDFYRLCDNYYIKNSRIVKKSKRNK